MKLTLLCALASIGLAATLHANLGDTETEIYKRYGKPVANPVSMTNQDITEYFEYKGCSIAVTFIGGQCQREIFAKKDKSGFTDREMQTFLDANANGHTWSLMNDNASVKIWVLDTKEAFAGYYKANSSLTLQTHVMLQFDNTVKALREKTGNEQQLPPPASQAQKP